jgi:hypothetical protein
MQSWDLRVHIPQRAFDNSLYSAARNHDDHDCGGEAIVIR